MESLSIGQYEQLIKDGYLTQEQYADYEALKIASNHDAYCEYYRKHFDEIVAKWKHGDIRKGWYLVMLNELCMTVEEYFTYDFTGGYAGIPEMFKNKIDRLASEQPDAKHKRNTVYNFFKLRTSVKRNIVNTFNVMPESNDTSMEFYAKFFSEVQKSGRVNELEDIIQHEFEKETDPTKFS